MNHPPNCNVAFIAKSVSTYAVSINVTGIGTTCDVTAGDDCGYFLLIFLISTSSYEFETERLTDVKFCS
jgi:hypothetical protein